MNARFPIRAALPLFMLAGVAAAQTTLGTITGAATDPTGAAMAKVAIEATHAATNFVYRTSSNDLGQYTLSSLREGGYTLRARAAGFKELVVQDVQLAARDVRRIDLRLELGAVESAVEVTAGATLIETETARIGDSRSDQVLRDLPLASRGVLNFVAITPSVGRSSTTEAQRRYGGGRSNQSDAQIDGISIADGRGGNTISPLLGYIESYQEARVDVANNSAEFGPIGMVTLVSKAGTNQLHGSLFDYYSTPWFRARNPFSPERPAGVRHWPGGSVGGPVVLPRIYDGRNRTFFFFSVETSRGSVAQDLLNPTVPLASWRAGDFSALAPATVVRDPSANNAPFAGNRIPTARLNPVAVKFQERFYPLPNFGDPSVLRNQNYREVKTRAFDPNNYWTTRVDHRFSPKASIYGRYTWQRSPNTGYDGNLPAIGQRWNTRDTRGAVVSFTYSVRPALLNEIRWGMSFNDNPRNGPLKGKEVVEFLGLQGLAGGLPDINGLFAVTFSGLGLTGPTQTVWRHPGAYSKTHQIQDQVSWFRGRHAVKAGFLISRVVYRDWQAAAALFGSAAFSNRYTGFPYADFLLGLPSTSSRAFPPLMLDQWRWSYEAFVVDQFKITPRITIEAGLRYEQRETWTDKANRQSLFDIGSGNIVVTDGSLGQVSPLMPSGYVGVVEAKTLGLPGDTLLKTDKNNFAPRIGMAWRLGGNRTVLRAGYGIFYDTVPIGPNVGGVPFNISEPAFTNPAGTPVVVLPRVFPASVGGPTTVSLPSAVRSDLRFPFSMQWNLTVEHERWNTGFRLSYVGTNTRQGEWTYDLNQPVADTRAYIDKPHLFPRYPAVNYWTNGAGHQYHSLSAEALRHLASGLFYQASWVWARDIGDLERGQSPENAYDRRRERSVWQDVPTHRITSAVIYELPFAKHGSRIARTAAAGWQLSAMYYYDSGQFLTPLWTGPDPTGTRYTTSRTAPQVSIRPDILRDPNLPDGQRSVDRWFDVGAFGRPAPGMFGTSAKGVIYGPNSTVFHLGVYKTLALRERVRLRFELTSTNLSNHPNWDNPDTNISTVATAGTISSTGGVGQYDEAGSRSFRCGVRLEW